MTLISARFFDIVRASELPGTVASNQVQRVMKADIHPKYEAVTMRCACGNTIETRSTNPNIHVEICAACHPYFTGKQRLMDTAGRVERFRQRYAASEAK